MQTDLLEIFVRINNCLGHISVQWCSTTSRYRCSGKKILTLNAILLLFIQFVFLRYTLKAKECYYDAYGVVLGTMYQLDGQLMLGLSYVMVLNGVLRSKDIIKLLNSLRSAQERIKVAFGGPKYAAL